MEHPINLKMLWPFGCKRGVRRNCWCSRDQKEEREVKDRLASVVQQDGISNCRGKQNRRVALVIQEQCKSINDMENWGNEMTYSQQKRRLHIYRRITQCTYKSFEKVLNIYKIVSFQDICTYRILRPIPSNIHASTFTNSLESEW